MESNNIGDGKVIPDFLDNAIKDLAERASNLTGAGVLVLTLTIVFGIFLFFDIKHTTERHLNDLNSAITPYITLIYLIVRSAALGTVAVSLLVLLAKIALACFDQATRFSKRRYGALFLKFMYQQHGQNNMQEKLSIDEIMRFFDAWNQNIESAFTTVRLGKRGLDPMEIKADKEGVNMKIGKN